MLDIVLLTMSNDIKPRKIIGVRLAPDTIRQIDELRQRTGGTRQDIIRAALIQILKA